MCARNTATMHNNYFDEPRATMTWLWPRAQTILIHSDAFDHDLDVQHKTIPIFFGRTSAMLWIHGSPQVIQRLGPLHVQRPKQSLPGARRPTTHPGTRHSLIGWWVLGLASGGDPVALRMLMTLFVWFKYMDDWYVEGKEACIPRHP